MLASLDEPPVAQRGLFYEPKYDGIRALVDLRAAGQARRGAARRHLLAQRQRQDAQFPGDRRARSATIARDARRRRCCSTARSSRSTPRAAARVSAHPGPHPPDGARPTSRARSATQPAALIVFDLLRDGDEDLRGQPLAARRLRLQERVRPRASAARAGPAERDRRRRRPRDARARARGRLGRAHRKDGHSLYHSGTPHAGVAQDEAAQAAGVRRRRLDRAAADARSTSARCCSATTTTAARCAGRAASARASIRRSSIASRRCCASARRPTKPVRRRGSRPLRTRALGQARRSSPRCGSPSGRATACCGSRCTWACATTRTRKTFGAKTKTPTKSGGAAEVRGATRSPSVETVRSPADAKSECDETSGEASTTSSSG